MCFEKFKTTHREGGTATTLLGLGLLVAQTVGFNLDKISTLSLQGRQITPRSQSSEFLWQDCARASLTPTRKIIISISKNRTLEILLRQKSLIHKMKKVLVAQASNFQSALYYWAISTVYQGPNIVIYEDWLNHWFLMAAVNSPYFNKNSLNLDHKNSQRSKFQTTTNFPT